MLRIIDELTARLAADRIGSVGELIGGLGTGPAHHDLAAGTSDSVVDASASASVSPIPRL